MPAATTATITNKSTRHRQAVWLAWAFSALITIVFAILALVTFANLIDAKHELNNNIHTDITLESDEFDAALAGTFMAAFLCIAVTIISFLLLAQKSLFSSTRGPTPGFAYAFMTSSFLHTAIFLILVGIILIGIRSKVEDLEGVPTTDNNNYWSSTDTAVLITTMVFSFIASGIYMVMFVCMILFRAAVQHTDDGGSTATSRLLPSGRMQSHHVTATPRTTTTTTTNVSPPSTTTTTPPSKRGGGAFSLPVFNTPPSPRLYDTPSDYADSVEMARRKQSYGAWGS